MTTYTIEKQENGELLLRNARGEVIPATHILEDGGERRVFAFYGKMGAGKTTFIKQLCQEMGTEDIVNSPTFAIVNVYEYGKDKEEIYHFDCYRLKDIREAMDFGAEEYLYSGNYCFIEWPEMIDALLPEDTINITIEAKEDGKRILTID